MNVGMHVVEHHRERLPMIERYVDRKAAEVELVRAQWRNAQAVVVVAVGLQAVVAAAAGGLVRRRPARSAVLTGEQRRVACKARNAGAVRAPYVATIGKRGVH